MRLLAYLRVIKSSLILASAEEFSRFGSLLVSIQIVLFRLVSELDTGELGVARRWRHNLKLKEVQKKSEVSL